MSSRCRACDADVEPFAEGRVLGFSVVLPREDGDAELDGLFVEPKGWGQGVGRKLVEHAAAQARTAGARSLQVIAGPRAEGFYARCGFERTGETPTRFGPAVLMRLPFSGEEGREPS